jgi:predicted DNA-binding protein
MSKRNISATVEEELLERLDAVAKETERNRSWLISNAIEAYLEDLEDLQLAKARLAEERLSPSEMRKKLGV